MSTEGSRIVYGTVWLPRVINYLLIVQTSTPLTLYGKTTHLVPHRS